MLIIIIIIIIIIITNEMNKIVVCSAISPTHVSSFCFSMILILRVQGHKVEWKPSSMKSYDYNQNFSKQ